MIKISNNICTVRERNKISDIPYGACVFLMIKISNKYESTEVQTLGVIRIQL